MGPEGTYEDVSGKIWAGYRKKILHQRVFGHWNRFPREVVIAPSLREFKKHLDNTPEHTECILELSCTGPGVGVHDCFGSLLRIFHNK